MAHGNSVLDFLQSLVDDTKTLVDDMIGKAGDVSDTMYNKAKRADLQQSIAELNAKLDKLAAAPKAAPKGGTKTSG